MVRLFKSISLITLLILLSSPLIYLITTPFPAFAAINRQINLQGKAVNADGTNVVDNAYDFVIKVYDGPGSTANKYKKLIL